MSSVDPFALWELQGVAGGPQLPKATRVRGGCRPIASPGGNWVGMSLEKWESDSVSPGPTSAELVALQRDREQDFQTRRHLPAWTDDLFASVVIRGFRRVDLACPSGAGRIETHGSVRVEFESTRVVHTAQTRRKAYDPTGQHGFKSPRGTGRDWPTRWPSRSMGKHAWQPKPSNCVSARRAARPMPRPFRFGSRLALHRLTAPIIGEAWAA